MLPPVEVPAGRYQHYKGPEYIVLDVARHSETEEWLVVYKLGYGDESTWVRPLGMFVETVTLEDGSVVPRFKKIA
ncbi:DUF1653 domain-containing protein [Neptuniibacter sp. PT8_73]|uniref:DUF1653 domain-containing protein n=1 Tax=unclassified Neptuniibacter TaxID=2630693 RepID=UPI0039F700B8